MDNNLLGTFYVPELHLHALSLLILQYIYVENTIYMLILQTRNLRFKWTSNLPKVTGHWYLGWNPNVCHLGAKALHCPNMSLAVGANFP